MTGYLNREKKVNSDLNCSLFVLSIQDVDESSEPKLSKMDQRSLQVKQVIEF